MKKRSDDTTVAVIYKTSGSKMEVSMETKKFKRNEIIFKKGDPGDCMYEVDMGRVGIFTYYGTPKQRLLTEYFPDQYFGEMGLLDQAPRSATAVALEDETFVSQVTEKGFEEFFQKNPMRVLMIMQQLSHNLRRRTNEYVEVCRKVKELAEKEGLA